MIIVITKALCYHQLYVADDLYNEFGNSFAFVQMREPLDWRIKNKQEGFERPYLLTYPRNPKKVCELVKNADVLIYGEAPLKLIRKRKSTCLLFKMSENIFKDTQLKISLFGKIKRWLAYKFLKYLTNNNHSFLLACGAFAYNDYYKLGIFKDRALKWGYFPIMPKFDLNILVEKFNSETVEMVWVSRVIEYKQPKYLLKLVEYLIKKGILNFHISVVGDSKESDTDIFLEISRYIDKHNLNKFISLVGSKAADEVFDYYKKSQIALFTADKSEGWSVGINEAMSCGCAIVCSNGIGSVPFLVGQKNGIVFPYNSPEEFCASVETLLKNPKLAKELAVNGFYSVKKVWNHENATKCLSNLITNYFDKGCLIPYESGPCSVAHLIDYSWYKEE